LRSLIDQNKPEAASAAFFEWVKTGQQQSEQQGKQGAPKTQQVPVLLGHEFVKELLNIILQPTKPKTGDDIPYSPKILQYLLERRVVSAGMVESGFLGVLRLRGDWQSISLAFNAVSDISEGEIISLLQSVVAHHKISTSRPPGEDAMQIDTPPSLSPLPTLPTFLTSIISYPTSPFALRLAIRTHLPEADDLVCVLEILEEWMARWNAMALKLLPMNVTKGARGLVAAKPRVGKRSDGLPLGEVISFLQTVLDASFLTLLQYTPAHDLLRRISSDLEPELNRVDQMEQLRGPLEPFARAQMKAVKESVKGDTGTKESQVDWRRKRKAAHEQAGMAVGLYRLEELVL